MQYRRFGDKIIARIDKGEEVIESLTKLAREENIRLGEIQALGAVSACVLRFYDADEKKYQDKEFREKFEITNFTGNISLMKGEPYLHCHMTLADRDYKARGGHVLSAVVGGTFEAVIQEIAGEVDRAPDPETGLNLYKL